MMKRKLVQVAASALLIAGLMAPTLSVHAATDTKAHVKVRVVGPNGYQKQEFLEVGSEAYKNSAGETIQMDKPTALGALVDIAALDGFGYSATTSQYGAYVTKIDNIEEKSINKNTAWMFYINGKLSDVGADQAELHDGDEVVVGFTDYTQTLYPKIEFSTTHPKVGEPFTVKVTAEQTTYDEQFNATTTVVPVEGATLAVVDGESHFTTDKDGMAEVTLSHPGLVTFQLGKTEEGTGLPLIINSGDLNLLFGNSNASFEDLNGYGWATDEISWMGQSGVVVGDGAGHFEPGRPVTRGELAKMVALLGDLNLGGSKKFSDLSTNGLYNTYIQTVARQGFMSGDAEGTFRANDPVTREELAVVMARYGAVAPASTGALAFSDNAQVSGYAVPYVEAMVKKGYLHGDVAGTFRPQAPASRAEVAKVLSTVYQDVNKAQTK